MELLRNVKNVLRCAIVGVLIILVIGIISINVKLYQHQFGRSITDQKKEKDDILKQLNFLGDQIKHEHLAERIQQIFPEGNVFTNALYGLAWCELALADSNIDKTIRTKAIQEALMAYKTINQEESRIIFDTTIQPRYGIFYCGWRNYLLSKIMHIADSTTSAIYKENFATQCDTIAKYANEKLFLPSYNNQTWPADMCVAIASLSNHDKIFGKKYSSTISKWMDGLQNNLDTSTLLIPHKVSAGTNQIMEGARGSSSSLMIRLLQEIDIILAQQQFQQYQKYFMTTTFGLPSIREYPKGKSGLGDIDSGPVVLGVGFSATITSIGTLGVIGNRDIAQQQFQTIAAFGLSSTNNKSKKFLLGKMPIADAFIAWGRASGLQTKSTSNENKQWKSKFQLISLITLALLFLIYIITKKRNALPK